MDKIYLAIDLKSFYASVECHERNLNPLTTNLVVADSERTEKTICLAVSPSLKQYGLPGRIRLYEVYEKIKKINQERRKIINYKKFTGKSYDDIKLKLNKYLELDFIIAKPRMSLYIDYSNKIYNIYLKYIAAEDIHVYSIDEVFIDATSYLKLYKLNARELASKIVKDIYNETGITATCGIGTNLYLAKVAMDIVAKHIKADENGVRIASLDVMTYRKLLWNHTPLTDFWRVGKGYQTKLNSYNIYTMGDVAKASLEQEELLFKLFGVNAELLIDHAWGYEPCTILDIKKYKPSTNSISSGQVLHCPYDYKKAKIVVIEMTDSLILELVEKNLVTKQIALTINYDIENLNNSYSGNIKTDYYGRNIPKESHGIVSLDEYSSSTKIIVKNIEKLFDKIIKKNLSVRRITIAFIDVIDSLTAKSKMIVQQLDLFNNLEEVKENFEGDLEKEHKIQKTIINIRNKYGKNAILKAMNLEDGATAKERNEQIGGHHA